MSVLEALKETTNTRSNDLEAKPEKELTEEELFSKLKKELKTAKKLTN